MIHFSRFFRNKLHVKGSKMKAMKEQTDRILLRYLHYNIILGYFILHKILNDKKRFKDQSKPIYYNTFLVIQDDSNEIIKKYVIKNLESRPFDKLMLSLSKLRYWSY